MPNTTRRTSAFMAAPLKRRKEAEHTARHPRVKGDSAPPSEMGAPDGNQVIEGKVVGPNPRRTTFDDVVKLIEQNYATNKRKSITSLRFRIARLKAAFGKTPPVEITHKVLKENVAKRLAEGVVTHNGPLRVGRARAHVHARDSRPRCSRRSRRCPRSRLGTRGKGSSSRTRSSACCSTWPPTSRPRSSSRISPAGASAR